MTRRAVIGVYAALLAPVMGCAGDAEPECRYICRQLDVCGMLPSILGVSIDGDAVENCTQRCVNSGGDLREGIRSCLGGVNPDYRTVAKGSDESAEGTDIPRGQRELWCHRTTPEKPAVCELAADCLSFNYGIEVLGEGQLRISTALGLHPNLNYTYPTPAEEQCVEATPCCDQPPEGVVVTSNTCVEFGVESVEFFVDRMGERIGIESTSKSCSEQLAGGGQIPLPTGRVTAGVTLRGVFPEPDRLPETLLGTSGEYCWTFWAPTTVITSSGKRDVFIHLPTTEELLRHSAIERLDWPESCAVAPDGGVTVDAGS